MGHRDSGDKGTKGQRDERLADVREDLTWESLSSTRRPGNMVTLCNKCLASLKWIIRPTSVCLTRGVEGTEHRQYGVTLPTPSLILLHLLPFCLSVPVTHIRSSSPFISLCVHSFELRFLVFFPLLSFSSLPNKLHLPFCQYFPVTRIEMGTNIVFPYRPISFPLHLHFPSCPSLRYPYLFITFLSLPKSISPSLVEEDTSM